MTGHNRRMRALITGPTAGLGLAFAHQLAARGCDLVLVARDTERLDALREELQRISSVQVECLPADLADREQLAVVEARVADAAQPIDILVNNAGFGLREGFLRSSIEQEQRMLDVLVTAVMRLCHAAAPGMIERGRGTIINVSSVASWLTGGSYSAAKAWCTVFSEGLANDLAGTGVTVTVACPGFIHTEFHARAGMNMAQIPDWMWLEARDVAAQALRDADRGRVISVAGAQYRLLSPIIRVLPRGLIRAVSAQRRR